MNDAISTLLDAGLVPHEYHVRCRDCRYSRKFGGARFTALVKCDSHGVRKGHTTDLRDNTVPVYTFIPTDRQSFDDVPPF